MVRFQIEIEICNIAWSTTGTVTDVDITHTGRSEGTISINTDTGSPYSWNVPLNTLPGEYFIRINGGSGIIDISAAFQIT